MYKKNKRKEKKKKKIFCVYGKGCAAQLEQTKKKKKSERLMNIEERMLLPTFSMLPKFFPFMGIKTV